MSVLNGLPARNVIPSYIEDVNESAWYVLEDAEKTYNEMMQGLAINELQVLESTGAVILNEDANEKGKFSLVEWLKKCWQNIKGFFEKIFKMVGEKVAGIKAKYFTKLDEGKIKKYLDQLDPKDKNGNNRIFGEYYEYTNIGDARNGGKFINALNTYDDAISNVYTKFADAAVNGDERSAKDIEVKMSNAIDVLKKNIGVSYDNEAGIAKHIKDHIRGKQISMDLTYVKSHIDDMIETCKDPKKIVKDMKELYNKIKASFDRSIKSVNSIKSNANTLAFSKYMPAIKYGKSVATQIASAALACEKEKMMADLKVVMRLQAAINKSFNESAVVEEGSTVVESSTYSKELRTLFNF